MMNPRQQARLGLFYLEEAILDILSDGEARPEIISKRVGIRSLTDERHTTSYSIVTGILVKLTSRKVVLNAVMMLAGS